MKWHYNTTNPIMLTPETSALLNYHCGNAAIKAIIESIVKDIEIYTVHIPMKQSNDSSLYKE